VVFQLLSLDPHSNRLPSNDDSAHSLLPRTFTRGPQDACTDELTPVSSGHLRIRLQCRRNGVVDWVARNSPDAKDLTLRYAVWLAVMALKFKSSDRK